MVVPEMLPTFSRLSFDDDNDERKRLNGGTARI